MKLLKTYVFQYQAQLDYIKLTDEGIPAVLEDENIVTTAPLFAQAVGGIKLFVKENDFDKAKKILETYEYDYLEKIFPEETKGGQIRCPKCGSMNVERKGSLLVGLLFLILFFVPATVKKSKYICLDCNYQWKTD